MSKKNELLFWMGVICLFGLMYKFVMKDSLIGVISQTLPSTEAGMLSGMLWGETTGFDTHFYQQLQATGIVHLVVVSGTNVLLVTTLVVEALAYLVSRKRAIIIGVGLMWWYCLTVGLDAPVLRAGLLLSLVYGSQFLGRKFDVWRGLGVVILLMVMADWRMLLTISFWLSFLAFIGLVTAPKRKYGEDFWRTLWISLWITPLLAITFGTVSLVGPVINLLVLWLVEGITVIGMVGMVVRPLLWLAYPLLHYVVILVDIVGSWRWAVMEVTVNWWMVAGWYVISGYWLIRNPFSDVHRSIPLEKGKLKSVPSSRERWYDEGVPKGLN